MRLLRLNKPKAANRPPSVGAIPQYTLYLSDCLDALKTLPGNSVDSLVTDPPAGISFMGKKWDSDKGGRDHWIAWLSDVMRECHRVLKPGAHGLVWAIPRTSHWTAMALENAGFEVRDVVTHLFGTGFPKSLDISKAIDKAAGAERAVIGKSPNSRNRNNADFMSVGDFRGKDGATDNIYLTSPATFEAKQWQGWGTALKPAVEHWILVRKPLSEKNVAANVLKHGTGGVNVDGCRLGGVDTTRRKTCSAWWRRGMAVAIIAGSELGRFPANLVLSHNPDCDPPRCSADCAVAIMDAQAKSNVSRFFYTAKASKSDRGGDFNKHPTVKPTKLMNYLIKLITPPGGTVLDPFMGSGTTGVSAIKGGWSFIGIEQDAESHEAARKRIATAPVGAMIGSNAQCI
jgi:DNA modification methylase